MGPFSESVRTTTTILPVESSQLNNFGQLVNWAFGLASLTLKQERKAWENYAASLGIAAIRTCLSICTLARSGNTQGVPTLTREVYELATRFVFCVEKQEAALAAGLQKELQQLRRLGTTQINNGVHTIDVKPWILSRETELKAMNFITPASLDEPETGANLQSGDRERYQLLCLGAHNRPGALLAKYNHHFANDQLDPFQQELGAHVESYFYLAAEALHSALQSYLRSALFPENQAAARLVQLESLFAPFRIVRPSG
jgi:hypothetical protein